MTKICGIPFGPVWSASGTQGFFGEGWRHHRLLRWFGLNPNFSGMTLVAKTTTTDPREGNMPTNFENLEPAEVFPRCIQLNLRRRAVVNSVGLTNPGVAKLLEMGRWQSQVKPFFISYMPVRDSSYEGSGQETQEFVELLKRGMGESSVSFGIQLNLSCPNTGEDTTNVFWDYYERMDALAQLDVPIIIKVNALLPVEDLLKLAEYEHCNGVCTTNTIPFGDSSLDWGEVWGSSKPPLPAEFGLGGYSGPALVDLATKQIAGLRDVGYQGHINGCGGIYAAADIDRYVDAGVDSVSLGSVAIHRPWRVQSLIQYATQQLGGQ